MYIYRNLSKYFEELFSKVRKTIYKTSSTPLPQYFSNSDVHSSFRYGCWLLLLLWVPPEKENLFEEAMAILKE